MNNNPLVQLSLTLKQAILLVIDFIKGFDLDKRGYIKFKWVSLWSKISKYS